MKIWEVALIAVGLAMDAFAVSVTRGLKMKRFNIAQAAVIALFFGGFQMLMPFLGWAVGRQFDKYIEKYDHWIALCLLVFLGVKMIWDSFRHEDSGEEEKFGFVQLLVMAVATSIDALAVGVTFSFQEIDILTSVALIGIITFVICIAGVFCGYKLGGRFTDKAEIIGGIILILIGVKIVLNSYNILPF